MSGATAANLKGLICDRMRVTVELAGLKGVLVVDALANCVHLGEFDAHREERTVEPLEEEEM